MTSYLAGRSRDSSAGNGGAALNFILMLTEKDATIPDALAVYARIKLPALKYVAFKDVGADPARLRDLIDAIQADGRQALLEIAHVSESGQRRGIELALQLGVDHVVGVWHPDTANLFSGPDSPAYWPFVGAMKGIPLELVSAPNNVVAHAKEIGSKAGVAGIVAMPYRQRVCDPSMLLSRICEATSSPVLVAGGVSNAGQIRSIARAGAWGFTIGGAILSGRAIDSESVGDRVASVLKLCRSPNDSKATTSWEDSL